MRNTKKYYVKELTQLQIMNKRFWSQGHVFVHQQRILMKWCMLHRWVAFLLQVYFNLRAAVTLTSQQLDEL
jgi:hypothetical protein